MVTALGPIIAGILTGSFVVEKVFAINGIGKYFISSITARDYPLIMGTTIFFAALLIACNYVVDLLYGVIDPRTRCKRPRKRGDASDMQLNPEMMKKYNISAEEIQPATAEEKESIDQMRPSVSYWKDAMRRFARNKLAMFMLFLLIVIVLIAVFGPIVSPYTYKAQSRDVRQGPSFSHPLGTDKLGRDIFVRVMYGTRISLLVGVVTMLLVCLIGITYGGIAAYVGGWCDNLMMRFVDLMMTIPSMLIIILLSVVMRDPLKAMLGSGKFVALASLGSGLISIFIVLALFNWLGMARSVRGALLMNRTQEYVLAAEAMGARSQVGHRQASAAQLHRRHHHQRHGRGAQRDHDRILPELHRSGRLRAGSLAGFHGERRAQRHHQLSHEHGISRRAHQPHHPVL